MSKEDVDSVNQLVPAPTEELGMTYMETNREQGAASKPTGRCHH